MTDPAGTPDEASHKEPSLGPACMVVAILLMATFFAVGGIGSWLVFSDQYPLAEKGITQQLIPWVETSQLAAEDKRSIVAQLEALLPTLRDRAIDKQQLSRLHNCLQDNPVLLWGTVESVVAQAAAAGLTETEVETVERVGERMLRMAADRQLSRRDLEFTLQTCTRVREDGASVEARDGLDADAIRDFMNRGQQLLDKHNVPNEPYDKTPAEAFAILIEQALAVQSPPGG